MKNKFKWLEQDPMLRAYLTIRWFTLGIKPDENLGTEQQQKLSMWYYDITMNKSEK